MASKGPKKWWVPLTPDMLGIVTLRYPKLNAPDTKGKYADNKFKTDVVPDAEAAKRFKEWALKIAAEKSPEMNNPDLPIKKDKDDGSVFISMKGKKKKDAAVGDRPIVIDAQRNPIPTSVTIRGGSKARVAGQLSNYDKGLHIVLEAVQVLELAGGAPMDASAFEVEEGFTVSEDAQQDDAGADEPAAEEGGSAPKGQFDL